MRNCHLQYSKEGYRILWNAADSLKRLEWADSDQIGQPDTDRDRSLKTKGDQLDQMANQGRSGLVRGDQRIAGMIISRSTMSRKVLSKRHCLRRLVLKWDRLWPHQSFLGTFLVVEVFGGSGSIRREDHSSTDRWFGNKYRLREMLWLLELLYTSRYWWYVDV